MNLRLTPYGRQQLTFALVFTVVVTAVTLIGGFARPLMALWGLSLLGLAAMAGFFRDPERTVPAEPGVLLAPADGKVTDITTVDQCEFLAGPAVRIGIFLSVFDVHVNRSPCRGRVVYSQPHAGACHNALDAERASRHNQAHSLGLDCDDHPADRVLVKQITGAIARRIVCAVNPGDTLGAGQRYGMIKFGSRTELFLPVDARARIDVTPGDRVRGGQTVLVRYAPVTTGVAACDGTQPLEFEV